MKQKIEEVYTLLSKANTENQQYREVLEDIVLWDIDSQYSVNFGSNGVRDYFRKKAREVLTLNRAEKEIQ